MQSATCLVQSLESRTLLSHAAHGEVTDSTIVADQQQLQSDTMKLKSDRDAGAKTLASDRASMKDHGKSLDLLLAPLRKQLEADKKAMRDALAADELAGKGVRDADVPAILADMQRMRADTGHADQLAIDKSQLDTDVAKFRADNAPFEAQTKADRAKFSEMLVQDQAAVDAAKSSANDQSKSDQAKIRADEKSLRAMLAADETAVKADAAKLKADLKAGKKSDGDKHDGKKPADGTGSHQENENEKPEHPGKK